MFSKLIGSRKNRRQGASSLRIEVQQLEVRILPAAGMGGGVVKDPVIHRNPAGCPLEAVHGGGLGGSGKG